MPICERCGEEFNHRNNTRHQKTFRCQKVCMQREINKLQEQLQNKDKKLQKYKKQRDKYKSKYVDIERLYEKLLDKGIGNTTYNIDNSNKTTNQYLNLQGYTLDALKDKMGTFPVLNYQNGRKASEQVARFVAENIRGENDELTVICTDQERQKFYCLEDDKWIEDVSKQKTVSGVCQCIKNHFGDEKTFINKLVEKRKQELQDETTRMLQGIENENDLQRDLLSYKSKVSTTVSQIIACSGGGENEFSKGYLKKLSGLVRGTKSQRKAVKQMSN